MKNNFQKIYVDRRRIPGRNSKKDWKNKKERLLEMRETLEISREKLNEILEINNSHPLFYALGTRTWFWKIEINNEDHLIKICMGSFFIKM